MVAGTENLEDEKNGYKRFIEERGFTTIKIQFPLTAINKLKEQAETIEVDTKATIIILQPGKFFCC